MKRLFPLLLLLILTLTYSDAMAIWTINGKLKLIEGNEFSGGNAYYSCPEPDPQKCMTGDGTSITLWGRDSFGGENQTMLHPIIFDVKKETFGIKDTALPRAFPSNYYQRIDDSWSLSAKFSNHTILYYMANSIYSTYHNKMIRIPYPNLQNDISSIRNGDNFYSPRENCFYLMYTLKDKHDILFYLSFDENGERKSFSAIKNKKLGPGLLLNPYEKIQFINSTKCFEINPIID